jgi:hypothetical protein
VLQAMATQAGNAVNLHFIRECVCGHGLANGQPAALGLVAR